ncbi:MAG TPA: hypothetical protein DEP45_13200 [Armatimonadetes bacterium]|nr:hypothetical protein [Armatimonadota bacterium]
MTEFGKQHVLAMYDEMLSWLAAQQVGEGDAQHSGAIYFPSEDRFCNRDTACAAMLFAREARRSGDAAWLERASRARDYVLRVQKPNGGFPELRHREQSDEGSTVNTSIVADSLMKTHERGLDLGARDLDALARMADFELTLEWQPGAFYHDMNHLSTFVTPDGARRWGEEGSRLDCQNTTALAAMMLLRISDFLLARGREPRREWREASSRAVERVLAGQDPDGQWPYRMGGGGRDAGHHAMVILHLAQISQHPEHAGDERIRAALLRGGEWLLACPLLNTRAGTKIDWAISRSALTYFTTEYFFIAAALARLCGVDPEHADRWQHEALELLRYVRGTLWDNPKAETEGPFCLTEAGLTFGYAWFGQSMGWVLYHLEDLISQLGWWE